jgi:membrane fusion protein (multidrug efflux system)
MPGQFVRVRPLGLRLKNVVLIPRQAILITQQGNAVYVVDKDMQARLRPVTEQMTIGAQSVISSGLVNGERIITAGLVKVQPGAPVRIAAPEAAQAPQPTPATVQ